MKIRIPSGLVAGTLSGLAATLPMTAAMRRIRRREPREWLKALPPRKITLRLAHRAGLGKKLDRDDKRRLIALSHYGYGAAAGGLYGLLPGRMPGILYGLAVWAISYLGLMPALSLYRPANRDASSRNRLMILSHLVWGAFLGMGMRLLAAQAGTEDSASATAVK
ncbi:MAG: conserved rane protein of unknown function [Fibrobacteres bacterium]|nr:conserved rane protein of unknown function [Fibrobacterota bacterium]